MRNVRPVIKNPESWLILFLGALATYFFIQTFHYRFSAALFPRIVSAVVALLCYWHLGENILKHLRTQPDLQGESNGLPICLPWYGSFALILLYLLLVFLIGFVWGTGLFMIFFPAAAGYRRWPVILATAVATAIIIETSFNRFLEIQLHQGILFAFFSN